MSYAEKKGKKQKKINNADEKTNRRIEGEGLEARAASSGSFCSSQQLVVQPAWPSLSFTKRATGVEFLEERQANQTHETVLDAPRLEG